MNSNNAYLIKLNQPVAMIQPGQIVIFHIRLYAFDAGEFAYEPAFRRDGFIRLRIKSYQKRLRRDHNSDFCNHFLPYILDGYPQDPLPAKTSLQIARDPILSRLTPECRMVFRYDPAKDIGCLVHIGLDFPLVDQSPYVFLWHTAAIEQQTLLLGDKPLF